VVFYPRVNLVALEFRYELVTYRQFWDQAARQRFIEALELYKQDFENRRLQGKYNRSRAVYGKAQGRAEWETFRFSATYKSSPFLELGYRFRGESPYFTVLQRSAKEETGITSSSDMESRQLSMYYTRAQGEKLAQLFNQEALFAMVGLVGEEKPEPKNEPLGDLY
jgi:hypothetical protein